MYIVYIYIYRERCIYIVPGGQAARWPGSVGSSANPVHYA